MLGVVDLVTWVRVGVRVRVRVRVGVRVRVRDRVGSRNSRTLTLGTSVLALRRQRVEGHRYE